MMASHFSIGNSSIGETNWMPALLTRTSTDPKVFSPSAIIPSISAGLVMSAGEWIALTLKSLSMAARSLSISAGAPMPLMTMLAPAPAKARAYANPMPLVEPVTTAVLPVNVPISTTPFAIEGLGAIPGEIVSHHGFAGLRPFQPFGVAHRKINVALARAPVFDHADAREIVILGGRFVILAAVDQMHHGNGILLGGLAQDFDRRIALQLLGQFADQVAQRPAGIVNLFVLVGVHSGAAGKANVLFALRSLQQRNRQMTARAEQVDLKDQKCVGVVFIQHVIERRVGGDAAVPVMLAFDHDGREAWRQRTGGHDVLRTYLFAELLEFEIIEISEVARGHADGADAEPGLEIVDPVEIHQMLQRPAKRPCIVIALRVRAALRPHRRRRQTRREEAGHAEGRNHGGAGFVEKGTPAVVGSERTPGHRR